MATLNRLAAGVAWEKPADLFNNGVLRAMTPSSLRTLLKIRELCVLRDEDARAVLGRMSNGVFYALNRQTNDRLLGKAVHLTGISVRECVFGPSYSHVVNAAFTHTSTLGNRFNGPERGAWYAGFSKKTSELKAAYHRSQELKEVRWAEREVFTYVDFLADFRGEFHDLRGATPFANCLDPSSYKASQRLASELLEAGSAGVVYPSVRHAGGVCIGCFRPALVNNVRNGQRPSVN